ncbi:DUF2252 family protein [Acidisphaera sp. L21]|uniref:DUF2252 family protein n=1 Tax=Acidisphaera sp. L21 TaxID=1641851 RepID=UPI0030042B3E
MGKLRYAVLVAVGKGRNERHCLIDVKEAVAPDVPTRSEEMPSNNGERVTTGARSLSPGLGDRMLALPFMERAVTVRELLPQDLKLEIEHLPREQASRWQNTCLLSSPALMAARWRRPPERIGLTNSSGAIPGRLTRQRGCGRARSTWWRCMKPRISNIADATHFIRRVKARGPS